MVWIRTALSLGTGAIAHEVPMSRHVSRLITSVALVAAFITVPAAVTTPSAEATCRPKLRSLTLARTTVTGGSSTTATVGLSCRVHRRTKVRLWASTGIQVPAYVYVARGRSTHKVTVRATPTTTRRSGTVKATYGRTVRRRTLVRAVTPCYPTAVPAKLALPASVEAGQSASGTVTMDCVARTALAVSLTSSSSSVTVPRTLTVRAGQRSATFKATTREAATGWQPTFTVTIRATRNRTSAARTMQVRPRAFRAGDKFGVNQPILTADGPEGWLRGTLRITLDHPAPLGGLVVNGAPVTAGTTVTEATVYHHPDLPDAPISEHIVITDSHGTVLLEQDFTYQAGRGS